MKALKELEDIRKKKKELEILEKEASKPVLNNLENIQVVFLWFNEIAKDIDGFPKEYSVMYRKLFIYIILLLYSPGCLLGDKMTAGLRSIIANLLNVNTESIISDNRSDVWFQYNTYKDFSKLADYLYCEILFRIELNGLK